MGTIIFDGEREAEKREVLLRARVKELAVRPRLCSLVMVEDEPSVLYTRLKKEAAVRVGIEFDVLEHSMREPVDFLHEQVELACRREDVTAVMIQKPGKRSWLQGIGNREQDYMDWWHRLTAGIDPQKDADCMTQTNLQRVYAGQWQIVPATVGAIIEIIQIALGFKIYDFRFKNKRITIVGRSELVGKPLAAVLEQRGAQVSLCGSQTPNLDMLVGQADVVVSATGVAKLIKGKWIKPGAVVIDVGSPYGDVEYGAAVKRAGFITPVPFGVGPMTVVSLLENVVEICKF